MFERINKSFGLILPKPAKLTNSRIKGYEN